MAASSVYTKSMKGGAGKSVVKSELTSEIGKITNFNQEANIQSASISNFKQEQSITEPVSSKKPVVEEEIVATIQLPAFDQPDNNEEQII